MNRICNYCKKDKNLDEYHLGNSKYGKKSICKDCKKIESSKYYIKNKEKHSIFMKEYYISNKDKILKYQRIYEINKLSSDILYKLAKNLRGRTNKCVYRNKWYKTGKFAEYIGCSLINLKQYLSLKFIGNMSWDNYGQWHIDHIIPLSRAKTIEEMYKLCHYTNLQPLWAKDNLKKGNRDVRE